MPVHPTPAVNIYWEHHLKLELDIVCVCVWGGCQDLGALVGTGFLEAKAIQDSMGTARKGQSFLSSYHHFILSKETVLCPLQRQETCSLEEGSLPQLPQGFFKH